MATTLPPARKKNLSEAEIEAVINRGGSTISKSSSPEKPKHINIRLTEKIIGEIEQSRAKRPRKPGSPKLGISIHDWIVEAVLDKLSSESQYEK
ncbi:hypothetical protein [Dyadobacter sediminis]|uniref:Uncharacterized protein n=1 Tax=Dyadobacter sediminis TaxID=1493691 RepID=A0A5R9KGZ3_9BACT|nr:hypothetical protein [Dyadobacter sediminis]TLU95452.1 hypothetical protein FEM55_07235 [Dyadobacter sediminis]GGC14910.1 hypothetical protein GCM10011325_47190 [Dyadobacter sediminis]